MAECKCDYSETYENEISDEEVSRMAYQVPPDEIRRFAVEYLKIAKLDIDHARAASPGNAYEVASKCFDIWRRRYCGLNMRGDLYRILCSASKEGFMPKDAFQFLLEHPLDTVALQMIDEYNLDGKETESSTENAVMFNDSCDTAPFAILNKVANEISSTSMEEAAISVFGFTRREVRIQKRLAEHQVMFHLLCTWWKIQQGSGVAKSSKLLEKLIFAQEKGLLSQTALSHFRKTLKGLTDSLDFASQSTTRDQGQYRRLSSIVSTDSDSEECLLVKNSTVDTLDRPSRLWSSAQWIRNQMTNLFSRLCARSPFQRKFHYTRVPSDDESLKYDAFVSYSQKDNEWVVKQLIPYLEGKHGLHVCLHIRDFLPSRTIEANIMASLYSCRKAILIVSTDYFESGWCNAEATIAHQIMTERHDPSCVICVVMPGTDLGSAPHPLNIILLSHTYIEVNNKWALMRIAKAVGLPLKRRKKIVEITEL